MWFLSIFGRVFAGFWRLFLGLIIGFIFYIWLFLEYKVYWEQIEDGAHTFMKWLVSQPYLSEFSQWSTLLNLDEKLAFALYIVVGRMIWLVIEAVIIKFPYWVYKATK